MDVTEDKVGVEDITLVPIFPKPGDTNSTNDNYLLGPTLANNLVQSKRVVQRTFPTVKLKLVDSSVRKLVKTQSTASLNCQNVSCLAVNRVLSVCSHRLPQKSLCKEDRNKRCQSVFHVNQCLSVPHAPNVPSVVPDLPVGGRLQSFWQTWQKFGANPRVVSILKEGYTLPFKIRPPLTQSPVIKSGYAHPLKSKALFEALVELIVVGSRKSRDKVLPGVLQPPFSGTKTQQQMETYSGSQPSKPVFAIRHVQNGNTGNNQVVSPIGGMGNIAGFQRRLFSHSHQSEIPEVPQVFLGRKTYHFIALIHPIQWTNAIPVGATGLPNVRKRRPVFPPASLAEW